MNPAQKKIIVIIPTYNEAANIRCLIERIFSLKITGLSVLVVDDSSPDLTYKEVEDMQARCVDLWLIRRPKKRGLASAYKQGFGYALQNNYDIVIQMDGDLSHSPEYLPRMLSCVEDCDLVIGSRYVKEGGVLEWSNFRMFLSKYANMFCKFMLRIPLNDFTSGFKCLRREVLENVKIGILKSEGYSFQIEISMRVFLKGFKIKEIPIQYRGRKKEKSKFSFFIIIEAFCRVLYWSSARFLAAIFSPKAAAKPSG